MARFFIYKKNVFKYLDNKKYYLMMTGWDKLENKDRRYIESEFDNDKLIKINKNVALKLINDYWDSGIRTWAFDGNEYSNGDTYENAKFHKFIHTYKTKSGEERSYTNNYKLVWHQGHIYWAIHYHYYPRVQLHKFESIEKEPVSLDSFVKWTNASHCRAIVNLLSKEII